MALIREALGWGMELLRGGGHGNEENESRWALCSVLGLSSGELGLHVGDELSDEVFSRYGELLHRRAAGEPFQYVLGDVEFGDLVLKVGPGVLIPRPETEELVESCFGLLASPERICDLCTGSGAICLSLATRYPRARVYGTDLSSEALVWARRNLSDLGLSNVTLLQGDLFAGIPRDEVFDLVVSNPPYVSEDEYEELESVVKDWEPRLALVAADDGLSLLRRIASEALGRLRPGGWLLCEMGERHGAAMESCLRDLGYDAVEIRRDMSGHDRIMLGRRPH